MRVVVGGNPRARLKFSGSRASADWLACLVVAAVQQYSTVVCDTVILIAGRETMQKPYQHSHQAQDQGWGMPLIGTLHRQFSTSSLSFGSAG
jgi:hypothetical protein